MDFFSKCDQIRRKPKKSLLEKSLMENFIFCAVYFHKWVCYLLPMLKSIFKPTLHQWTCVRFYENALLLALFLAGEIMQK